MRVLLVVAFIFAHFSSSQAQIKDDAHTRLYRHVATYAFGPGAVIYSTDDYKNKAYVFGIAISINAASEVDSVYYTNRTSALDSLVSFKQIAQNIKRDKSLFQNLKNTMVFTVVYLRRADDDKIVNLFEFDKGFSMLMPDLYKLGQPKPIQIWPSMILTQASSLNKK